MAKVKEDKSRVTLEVDGKQAINQLGKLEMEAKQLALDMKEAKKGSDDYITASKKLKEVQANIKGVRTELGLAGMTMTQLSRYQRELRKEISNTTTQGTADYRRLQTELSKVNHTLAQQRKELNGTAGFFGDIKKELKSFAVLAVGALGVSELFSGIQNLISGSADLSDAISDVQKTTELTDDEMDKLMKRFKTFNTRTPRAELLALADEAGKMGKRGVDAVALYVQETNELTTALGQDLGEDAGLKVAKMAERFNVSMRQIGSGINAVADNTKAKAGFITEFLSRLAGTGNEVGIAAGDILGYGAAIDEMGLNVEMSSTALNGFLIEFTKNTEFYGKAAGFAQGELSKLVGEQGTNQGFLAFLERLRAANPLAADFLKKLEEIGIDGQRGSQVFLALAQNVDQLRDRQALANTEIAKGTSLTEEYNKKNENFAGNLEKIQKWLNSMFVNSDILKGLSTFVESWARWLRLPISKQLKDERTEVNLLYLRITDANLAQEDRIKLINELKTQYPQYLANINAERITNAELAKSIRLINDELINKIILQEKQEEIEDKAYQAAHKKMEQMDTEKALMAEMVKVAEKYGLKILSAGTIADKAENLIDKAAIYSKNQQGREGQLIGTTSKLINLFAEYENKTEAVNVLEGQSNFLLEEKDRLMKQLGITMEGNSSVILDDTVDPIIPDDPKTPDLSDAEKAKLKKQLEDMEAEWQKYLDNIAKLQRDYEIAGSGAQEAELLKVEYQYEKLEAELKTHLTNKTITQTEYDAQMRILQQMELEEHNRINDEYLKKETDAKLNAEQQILEATAGEKELAILKTNQHYDQLIDLARQFGLDTVSIEEARRRELQNVQKKFDKDEIKEAAEIAEAKQMIAAGLSSMLGSTIDFIGNKQGELTGFQKALTAAQIGIDVASALAKTIPLAVDAAKAGGPAAPFLLAGYIATMAATVFGAAAKAKTALSSADVPEYGSDTGDSAPVRGRNNSTPKKSFFWGGHTGTEGIGTGDQYGPFAGAVHTNEYVVPSITTTDPVVANLLPAIEQVRQDNVKGFTSSGAGAGLDTKRLEAKLDQVIQVLNKAQNKKVILVSSDLEEHEEEKVMLADRYSA